VAPAVTPEPLTKRKESYEKAPLITYGKMPAFAIAYFLPSLGRKYCEFLMRIMNNYSLNMLDLSCRV
jgi:hypothetical protein